jgi:hypothetical protein
MSDWSVTTSTSYRISRLLGMFDTKMGHRRAKKILLMVGSVKDDLGLKVLGVCSSIYECGELYKTVTLIHGNEV